MELTCFFYSKKSLFSVLPIDFAVNFRKRNLNYLPKRPYLQGKVICNIAERVTLLLLHFRPFRDQNSRAPDQGRILFKIIYKLIRLL